MDAAGPEPLPPETPLFPAATVPFMPLFVRLATIRALRIVSHVASHALNCFRRCYRFEPCCGEPWSKAAGQTGSTASVGGDAEIRVGDTTVF